jgi:hypothetical protein
MTPRRGYAIYLCGLPGPLVDPNPDCPQHELHTPQPNGYIQCHDWAEEMSKTHKQIMCDGCDRLLIWIEKRAGSRIDMEAT